MLLADGRIARDATIVCMVTGHGFKDFKVWRAMPAADGEDLPSGAIPAPASAV